ncbi:hypothetical protein ACFXHA_12950 [Nocardia sp. NPDC059240]|uniref:hypothetical protein n=1 Tax=Nocardia sp. NPDC059240 TaxID=3346786 RepID=UPI00368A998D
MGDTGPWIGHRRQCPRPEAITMVAPQPLAAVIPAGILLVEQALAPITVPPSLGAILLIFALQLRLASSSRRGRASILVRFSPLQRRLGMLIHLVDDSGRRWEARFLPVTAMELDIGDPVFTEGRIDRRGRLRIRAITNIRTGVRRLSRGSAVWPIVVISVVVMILTAAAAV